MGRSPNIDQGEDDMDKVVTPHHFPSRNRAEGMTPLGRFGLRCVLLCLAVWGALFAAASSIEAVELGKGPAAWEATAETASPPRTIADLKALEQRIQKTVAQVSASVVSLAGGSGVVISSDGYLLTVAHVDEHAGRWIVVVFPDGRRARAVTLGNDHGADAGMAKITDPGPWPHAEMASSADLKPGQWCLTLGYPITFEHGKPPVLRIGRVLRNEKPAIITDCTIMGGDSGAPLFNLDGKVVAIGTMCDRSLSVNLHVPMDRFSAVWDRLAKGEDFDSLEPKPLLGVSAAEAGGDARIGAVTPGSGADHAGLKPGDVLLKFGGKEIHKFEELPPLVQQHKPGDKVDVELRRGTETLKVQVTLDRDGAGEGK
jgi:serine protease Do